MRYRTARGHKERVEMEERSRGGEGRVVPFDVREKTDALCLGSIVTTVSFCHVMYDYNKRRQRRKGEGSEEGKKDIYREKPRG